MSHQVAAGKRTHEDHERGPGHVKVRQETVNDPKGMAGSDEQVGRTTPGRDHFIRGRRTGGRLERAHRRRPDRDDPPAVGSRRSYRSDGLRRTHAPFGMHRMIVEAIGGDGSKRIEPHVERDRRTVNASGLEGREKLVRKMKAGGRCRG